MPDLHTELSKISQQLQEKQMNTDLKGTISEWANTDTQEPDTKPKSHKFTVTNNVSRETFYDILNHPSTTFKEVVTRMAANGFNPTSVGSLIVQMVKSNMVEKNEHGKLYALQAEYTPVRNATMRKAEKERAKKKNKVAKPDKRAYTKTGKYAKTGIAALKTQAEVVAAPTPVQEFDPSSLLSTLSFPQVMALYKQIKTMLGEA